MKGKAPLGKEKKEKEKKFWMMASHKKEEKELKW